MTSLFVTLVHDSMIAPIAFLCNVIAKLGKDKVWSTIEVLN